MELLEYLIFNYAQQNEKSVILLQEIYESLKETLPEEERAKLIKSINLCKGYTEYRVKDISNDTGFTKTKIKYLVKQLVDDGKVELVVVENITFLKPIL